ncbi:Progestin and adipoQ receptor member 3 [Globomyces sp. JEL0801]|nr:Progestin and adipoQ receptor member 3 [Globomyces sp. JEL0801]
MKRWNKKKSKNSELDLIKKSRYAKEYDLKIKDQVLTKGLYRFDTCPSYMRDNDWIMTGYRANYSFKEAWISFFEKHNECGNMWSHGIGALIFVFLTWYTWVVPLHPNAGINERIVLTLFVVFQFYTLFASTLFHTHICVSEEAFIFYRCLDFSGISASLGGGCLAITYSLLHCDGSLRTFWMTVLILPHLVGVIGPCFQRWGSLEFRTGRSIIYILSVATLIFPFLDYYLEYGTDRLPAMDKNPMLYYMGLAGVQISIGTFFYISRFPERYDSHLFY